MLHLREFLLQIFCSFCQLSVWLHPLRFINAAYCCRQSSMVGLSVCLFVTPVSPAKKAEPIEMCGPKESCIRWGRDSPWEWAVLGVVRPIKKYDESTAVHEPGHSYARRYAV